MRHANVALGKVVVLVALAACAPAAAPTSSERGAAETCGRCHAAQYTEWQGSWHRRSFTDADFQSSHRADREQLCVDCHAPARSARGDEGAREGIGCASCHRTPARHGRDASAHASTVSCRGCHDFPVPGTTVPLQTTWTEHEASPFSNVACVQCHAPERAGHHDHTMSGARDVAVLRAALHWSVRREGGRVLFTIVPVGVGHRFPTGDLYRRLRAEVLVEDPAGHMIGHAQRSFRRDWDEHAASLRQHRAERTEGDTRLDQTGATFEIECTGAPAQARVTVTYDRGRFGTGEDLQTFETLTLAEELVPLLP